MATAAPHVKLLRQLASAKDDYLSGAFDISWDGAKATLYLVFGRPSHAVFDTDQAQIEGEAAIDALLAELPRTFVVSDWRRAMSPQETLSISIDELAGPFVRLAGSYADDPVSDENPEWWTADDSSPDLAFGLADFPLLPGGRPLWAETSPENVNLAERLAELPPSILILTGAKLRAAAVVSGGDLIDAVWIDDEDQARGEAAGMALLGATKGSLAGYALDDPRVAEALTMLWRLPLAVSGVELAWLDPASMLAAFRADGLDRVLVIDAPVKGIALFSRGGLVAVYSETQRSAVASPERLRSLLSQARGRLTVMERKPRPAGAAAAHAAPSATDFFGVLAPEAPAESTPDAEPVTAETQESHDDESLAAAAPAPDSGEVSDSPSDAVAAPEAAPEAAEAPDHDFEAVTSTESTESDPATVALDASELPPPPPPDADPSALAEHAPPPPAPELSTEPETKTKRRWWSRGGRKNKSATSPATAPEASAPEAPAAPDAEAASFSGWSVRQPDPDPQPVWQRSRDTGEGSDDVTDGALPPPPDADAAEEHAPAATWSVVDPATVTREPSTSDAVDAVEPESPPAAEPETAASQGWSARDVLADSVGWYKPAEPAPATDAEEGATSEDTPNAAAEPAHEGADQGHGQPVTADHEPEVATDIESADSEHPLFAAADQALGAIDAEPVAVTTEPTASDAGEHAPSADAGPAHDFWAEFASPDPAAEADSEAIPAESETETETALATTASTESPDESHTESSEPSHEESHAQASEESHEQPSEQPDEKSEHEPAAAEHPDPLTHKSSERTLAPWSWPLAEDESAAASGSHARSAVPDDHTSAPATTSAHSAESTTSESGASQPDDWAPVFEGAGEQSFFHRDEPVGSQFVDFDEVRSELVQIGVVWLGEANAVPVTALLRKTRSTIDDFVATIDTIRGLHLEGQDPASVQAMAREMHQQAAERLCGA